METDAKIDWLSFTIHEDISNDRIAAIAGTFETTGDGRNGYRQKSVTASGVQCLFDGSPGMGKHFILTGKALENVRDLGYRDLELCDMVLSVAGKTSRLDLALDIIAGVTTVQDVETAWMNGEMITPAKSSVRTTSFPNGGDTLYIGSRTSERMLRCYNKAAEQGIVNGEAWLRLELEIKRMRARATLDALATTEQTRWVINRAFRDFADWDNDEFRDATDDNFASIADIPRKMPNTLIWLQTQVAPAMAKYQNNNPGVDIRAILSSWVEPLLNASDVNLTEGV